MPARANDGSSTAGSEKQAEENSIAGSAGN
jgi:hypothetical protein